MPMPPAKVREYLDDGNSDVSDGSRAADDTENADNEASTPTLHHDNLDDDPNSSFYSGMSFANFSSPTRV